MQQKANSLDDRPAMSHRYPACASLSHCTCCIASMTAGRAQHTSCRMSCLLVRFVELGSPASAVANGLAAAAGSTSEASSASSCISLLLLSPPEADAGAGTGGGLGFLGRWAFAAAALAGALLLGTCVGASSAAAGLPASASASDSELVAWPLASLSPAQQRCRMVQRLTTQQSTRSANHYRKRRRAP